MILLYLAFKSEFHAQLQLHASKAVNGPISYEHRLQIKRTSITMWLAVPMLTNSWNRMHHKYTSQSRFVIPVFWYFLSSGLPYKRKLRFHASKTTFWMRKKWMQILLCITSHTSLKFSSLWCSCIFSLLRLLSYAIFPLVKFLCTLITRYVLACIWRVCGLSTTSRRF